MTTLEHMLRLTDEELAVLTDADAMAVRPVLDAMEPGEREIALRTAYRGLVSRELIDPPTADEEGAAVAAAERDGGPVRLPVRMPEPLSELLALRAGPEAGVAVSRTTILGQDLRYAYASADVLVTEEVTVGGMHTFAVGPRSGLLDVVHGWVVSPDAQDGVGPSLTLPVPDESSEATVPDEILAVLGEAHLRADVVVRAVGESAPLLVAVFSGPRGVWIGSARFGAREPMTLDAVRLDEVGTRLATELADVLDAGAA